MPHWLAWLLKTLPSLKPSMSTWMSCHPRWGLRVTAVDIMSWGAAGVFPEQIFLCPWPAKVPEHLSPLTAGEELEPWMRLQSSVLIFIFFSMMVYHRTLNIVPCAMQWNLIVYPPYIL